MAKLVQYRNFGAVDQNFIINWSEYRDVVDLTAGVAKLYTIPAGMNSIIFSSEDDFWVLPNDTPILPAGDITDGSAAELNPYGRRLEGVATLGFIAPRDTTVNLILYE